MEPRDDPAFVDSASDDRTVNNVMRHAYRVLSDDEKQAMQDIKDVGLRFYNLIDNIGMRWPAPVAPDAPRGNGSRELSLAKTKVEEAVMWAVKHITA